MMQISFTLVNKKTFGNEGREHKHANSAVYDHLNGSQVCKDRFSVDLFKILESGRNDVETTIKEALYIKSHKPMLSRELYTQGSSFILNIF